MHIDFILHATSATMCNWKKHAVAILWPEGNNSHNKFVPESIRKFERVTTKFRRSFVRLLGNVWSATEQRSRSLVFERVLFLEESTFVLSRAVGRSVPLPGLRTVDYAVVLGFTCTLVRRATRYRLQSVPISVQAVSSRISRNCEARF